MDPLVVGLIVTTITALASLVMNIIQYVFSKGCRSHCNFCWSHSEQEEIVKKL